MYRRNVEWLLQHLSCTGETSFNSGERLPAELWYYKEHSRYRGVDGPQEKGPVSARRPTVLRTDQRKLHQLDAHCTSSMSYFRYTPMYSWGTRAQVVVRRAMDPMVHVTVVARSMLYPVAIPARGEAQDEQRWTARTR